MASTWNLSKGLAAVVITSAVALGLCPSAAADPSAAQPSPELPGLPALSQLSPIIQQAASDPASATQLLMAAASAFTHSSTTPTESKNVASSVTKFVEPTNPGAPAPAPSALTPPETLPAPHVPAPGVEPGFQSHLPQGINPTYAAGPPLAAPPAAAPPAAAPPAAAPPAAAPRPPRRKLRPLQPRPRRPRPPRPPLPRVSARTRRSHRTSCTPRSAPTAWGKALTP